MFKVYTRKSTAMIGAERAGFDRSVVTQNEAGEWGFETNPVRKVVAIAKAAPKCRRKQLNNVYRAMRQLRLANKRGNGGVEYDFLRIAAKALKQSYRKADIVQPVL